MRRRTKVLVGPCSKYFSTFRSWIMSDQSFSRSSSFTAAGLAWPRLAFITWPTRKSDHRGLAAAVLLHLFRIGGDHFVDDLFERAGVADLLQAFALDDGCRRRRRSRTSSGKSPWPACRRARPARSARPVRPGAPRSPAIRAISLPSALSSAQQIAHHPVGRGLADRPRPRATVSK